MEITGMFCLIDKADQIVHVFSLNLDGMPQAFVPHGTKLVFLRFADNSSKPPKGLPRPRAVKVMPREFTEVRK